MADEKLVSAPKVTPKVGAFDITQGVTVYATGSAKYHKDGEEITASQVVADKLVAQGWATKDKPKKEASK